MSLVQSSSVVDPDVTEDPSVRPVSDTLAPSASSPETDSHQRSTEDAITRSADELRAVQEALLTNNAASAELLQTNPAIASVVSTKMFTLGNAVIQAQLLQFEAIMAADPGPAERLHALGLLEAIWYQVVPGLAEIQAYASTGEAPHLQAVLDGLCTRALAEHMAVSLDLAHLSVGTREKGDADLVRGLQAALMGATTTGE